MAICRDCQQEMLVADGCDYGIIIDAKGNEYERETFIGWGAEERCGDCNAAIGHYHHFGCDMETCPRCGGQLISCDCAQSDSENPFVLLKSDTDIITLFGEREVVG